MLSIKEVCEIMRNDFYQNELYHYGVKGMKWGVRRARKNDVSGTSSKKRKTDNDDNQTTKKKGLSDRQKTALKIGAAAAGTALAAYGAYKVSNMIKDKAADRSYRSGKQIADKYLKEAVALKIDNNGIISKKNSTDVNLSNLSKYRNTMKYTDARTKKVSSSTIEAYKYLRNKDGRADISVGTDLYNDYVKGHYGDFRTKRR